MLERGALALCVLAALYLVALTIRGLVRRRASAVTGRGLPAVLRERLPAQSGGIVYFYGPGCAPCRQQAAVLDRLSRQEGIAVVRVDATREPALAGALAVATVPTTVIVDRGRTVRAVNSGFRSDGALSAQLRELR